MPVKVPGQIRKWTCHKLESFSEFIDSYSRTTRKADYCYLELFTGFGTNPCNGVDCSLEGTPLRTLKSQAKFVRYTFLAQSRSEAADLQNLLCPHNQANNIAVLTGNPNNENSILRLLDNVPRSASALVFIDPRGYRRLHWSTLEKLTAHGRNWQGDKLDLFFIFPLEMALARNLMRAECEKSITRFYGSQEWEEIKRQKLVNKIKPLEIKYRLIELFKNNLRNLGYRFVEDYKPASPTHDPYYHIIYASDKTSRLKNIKHAWGRDRFLRCELLYGIKN
jgi:three-Cys-motif partner protein